MVYLYRIFKARKLAIYFHFPRFCQATSGWSQICFLVLMQICEVMACPSDYIWKKTWQPAGYNKLCRRLMTCTIKIWTFSLLEIVKVTLALTLFTPAVSWDLPVYTLTVFFVILLLLGYSNYLSPLIIRMTSLVHLFIHHFNYYFS